MTRWRDVLFLWATAIAGVLAQGGARLDRSGLYRPLEHALRLAEGRWWGSVGGIAVDRDGRSVWVVDRCGGERCAGSPLNPVLKFDGNGNLVARFGQGWFDRPHGLHVDGEGHLWVADIGPPLGEAAGAPRQGHVVYQFSSDGRRLLVLGRAGVRGDGTGLLLDRPSDVVTTPEGAIYVADGSSGDDEEPASVGGRIVKFARDGTVIARWGRRGSAPGEFRDPHALAVDPAGRILVADRGNDRVQLFGPDGRWLAAWELCRRPSDLAVDRSGRIYVACDGGSRGQSEADSGIWIVQARDGRAVARVPARVHHLAVGARGVFYAAGIEPSALGPTRFVPNER
jgi:DNA-binding beta-propeller fold protein YncE